MKFSGHVQRWELGCCCGTLCSEAVGCGAVGWGGRLVVVRWSGAVWTGAVDQCSDSVGYCIGLATSSFIKNACRSTVHYWAPAGYGFGIDHAVFRHTQTRIHSKGYDIEVTPTAV